MSFDDFADAVRSCYDETSKQFAIGPDTFPGSPIASLFTSYLKIESLTLTDAAENSADAPQQAIIYSGSCTFARYLNEDSGQATLVFQLINDAPHLRVELALPPAWGFQSAYEDLKSTVFAAFSASEGSKLVFASGADTESGYAEGLNFNGELQPATDGDLSHVGTYLNFLTDAVSVQAAGPILEEGDKAQQINIALDVNSSLSRFFGTSIHLPLSVALIGHVQDVDGEAYTATCVSLSATYEVAPGQSFKLGTSITTNKQTAFVFRGELTDVEFPTPNKIAEWVGGDGDQVRNALPDHYRAANLIRLVGLQFELNVANPGVNSVSFMLSTTAQEPWLLFNNHFSIGNLGVSVTVHQPFHSPQATLSGQTTLALLDRSGGKALEMDLTVIKSGEQLAFNGRSTEGSVIDFGTVAKVFVPDVPDLHLPQIDKLDFSYQVQPQATWSLSTHVPEIPFPLAAPVVLKNVQVDLSNTSGDAVAGSVSGEVDICGVHTAAAYEIGGPFKLVAEYENFEVSPADVVTSLAGASWSLPSQIPSVHFTRTELALTQDGPNNTFSLLLSSSSKISDRFDVDVALGVERYDQEYGYILAAGFKTDLSIGDLISGLPDLFSHITVAKAALIVAQNVNGAYNVSRLLPSVNTGDHAIRSGAMLVSEIQVDGLEFGWCIDLFRGKSQNVAMATGSMLSALIYDQEREVFQLEIILAGNMELVEDTAFLDGVRLLVSKTPDTFSVAVIGEGHVTFSGQQLKIIADAAFGPTQASFTLVVEGTIPGVLGTPMDVTALVIGVEIDPKTLSGAFYFGGSVVFHSDKGDSNIGVFFELIAGQGLAALAGYYEEPSYLYIAHNSFCVGPLTADAVSLLDKIIIHSFSLIVTTVELTSDQLEHIGGKDWGTTSYKPGTFMRADVEFFGFRLYINDMIVSTNRISASIDMSPVKIGGKSLLLCKGKGDKSHGPHLVIDTQGPKIEFNGFLNVYYKKTEICAISQVAKANTKGIHYAFDFSLLWALKFHAKLELTNDGFSIEESIELGRYIHGFWVGVGGGFKVSIKRSTGVSVCIYVTCCKVRYNLVGCPKKAEVEWLDDEDEEPYTEEEEAAWRAEIEREADEGTRQFMLALTPETFAEVYKYTEEQTDPDAFYGETVSTIAWMYRHRFNLSCTEAAEAMRTLEPVRTPDDPSAFALALRVCDTPPDFVPGLTPDPTLYSAEEIEATLRGLFSLSADDARSIVSDLP